MISVSAFVRLIHSFEGITEQPHFEKRSFRYNKKILATLDEGAKQVFVKLDPVNQDVFSKYDPGAVHPVPNKWGKQGWTTINLPLIGKEMLKDILQTAYELSGKKAAKK